MAAKVSFVKNATRGIGAEIPKAPLVDGNQVAATGRKPEAVTNALATSDNLLSVALHVTRKDEVEVTALLPIIAVAFTSWRAPGLPAAERSFRVTTEAKDFG